MSTFLWESTLATHTTQSKILKLYYAYSLEYSPPIYILYAAFTDGSMKKFSTLKSENYPNDTAAFEAAKGKPFEIPAPIPDPPALVEKRERGPSCTIC